VKSYAVTTGIVTKVIRIISIKKVQRARVKETSICSSQELTMQQMGNLTQIF
jgi:hypothetical protein